VRYKHVNLIIIASALVVFTLSAACCLFVYTTYQQRVDELNMRLVEARQETARVTNKLYEANRNLEAGEQR